MIKNKKQKSNHFSLYQFYATTFCHPVFIKIPHRRALAFPRGACQLSECFVVLAAAEIHRQKKVIHSVVGVAVWKMSVAVFQLFRHVVQCKRGVGTR